MEEHVAKAQVHLFNGLVGLFALVGAAVTDLLIGKFYTIVMFSVVYLVGGSLMALFSINGLIGSYGRFPVWSYMIPALLIAAGAGGMKSCRLEHGADQFLSSQVTLIDRFYSVSYLLANVGALSSQYTTPYIKDYIQCFGSQCYFLAFGLPTLALLLALALLVLGHCYYRAVPPRYEFLPWKATKVTWLGLWRWSRASKQHRREVGNWLEFTQEDYGAKFAEETRLLLKIVTMTIPIIGFWILYDQNGTEWQNQYERMAKLLFWFIAIPTEASSNINFFLIIILTPALTYCIYPFLEKRGVHLSLLTRMTRGFLFLVIAFVVSTCLNYWIESYTQGIAYQSKVAISCKGCLNGTWQLPQVFLLSLGEAMLCPSSSEFYYTQLGDGIRLRSSSPFLMAVPIGNLVVVALEFHLQRISSPSNRQWVFVAISSLLFLLFVLLSKRWFVSKEEEESHVHEIDM